MHEEVALREGMEVVLVPLAQCHESGHQRRESLGDVAALAASIEAAGQLNPALLLRMGEGDYEIIAGHRRAAALRELGRAEIRAIVLDDMTDERASVLLNAENACREDLTEDERQRGIQEMLALGVAGTRAAAATGSDAGEVAAYERGMAVARRRLRGLDAMDAARQVDFERAVMLDRFDPWLDDETTDAVLEAEDLTSAHLACTKRKGELRAEEAVPLLPAGVRVMDVGEDIQVGMTYLGTVKLAEDDSDGSMRLAGKWPCEHFGSVSVKVRETNWDEACMPAVRWWCTDPSHLHGDAPHEPWAEEADELEQALTDGAMALAACTQEAMRLANPALFNGDDTCWSAAASWAMDRVQEEQLYSECWQPVGNIVSKRGIRRVPEVKHLVTALALPLQGSYGFGKAFLRCGVLGKRIALYCEVIARCIASGFGCELPAFASADEVTVGAKNALLAACQLKGLCSSRMPEVAALQDLLERFLEGADALLDDGETGDIEEID